MTTVFLSILGCCETVDELSLCLNFWIPVLFALGRWCCWWLILAMATGSWGYGGPPVVDIRDKAASAFLWPMRCWWVWMTVLALSKTTGQSIRLEIFFLWSTNETQKNYSCRDNPFILDRGQLPIEILPLWYYFYSLETLELRPGYQLDLVT